MRVSGSLSRILFPRRGGDHFSGTELAPGLERPTRKARARVIASPSLLDLSPGGVCPASPVTRTAVRSYRTVSPLPSEDGGLFSVALSLTLRPVAVSNHPDPWSPDFPPGTPPRMGDTERPPEPLTRESHVSTFADHFQR